MHNRIDAIIEQEIEGMDSRNGTSMQAMGAFVLSPKEECLMESEIIHIRRKFFVVKVVGS